jgi:hypothetical protein
MKHAIEMGSGAMIHIASFIKTGSVIQKLIGWDSQIHRQQCDFTSLPLFFKNKGSRLTMLCCVANTNAVFLTVLYSMQPTYFFHFRLIFFKYFFSLLL